MTVLLRYSPEYLIEMNKSWLSEFNHNISDISEAFTRSLESSEGMLKVSTQGGITSYGIGSYNIHSYEVVTVE